ncbi:MAG TPA: hypothetical protein VGT06_11820 [Candidatus Methylomirabilis sp.]|jgi:hypothetical protein|nr:hypothetical protein [Candidatus Methylomirabilis sp.]
MALETLLVLAGLGLSVFLVGFGLGILYGQRHASLPGNPAGRGSPPPTMGALPIPEELAPELGLLADDLARAATERWEAARGAAGPPGEDPPPADEEVMIFDRVSLGISKLPLFASHTEYEVAERGVMASVAKRYGLTSDQVAETYRKVHAWKWRHGGESATAPV